jgi:hypothetical protein
MTLPWQRQTSAQLAFTQGASRWYGSSDPEKGGGGGRGAAPSAGESSSRANGCSGDIKAITFIEPTSR